MNVKEIIEKYLVDNGYDGLCGDECGCAIGDLRPCDGPNEDCVPAFAFAPADVPDAEPGCDICFSPQAPKCSICGKEIDVTMPNSFGALDEPLPRRRAHMACVWDAMIAKKLSPPAKEK
jgi:hypothetical protein